MIATLRAAETIPIASNSIKYLHRGYGESISEYLCKMQGWRKVVRRTPRVFVPPTLRRLFFLPSLHFDPLYSSRSWNVNFHETSRAYERYVSRYTDSSLRTNVKTTSLSTLCLYRPVVTPLSRFPVPFHPEHASLSSHLSLCVDYLPLERRNGKNGWPSFSWRSYTFYTLYNGGKFFSRIFRIASGKKDCRDNYLRRWVKDRKLHHSFRY